LDALVQQHIKYERHGQHFSPGTQDTAWLPVIGEKGWVLVTKDKRIRFNDLEREAVVAYRVWEFYFTSGNYSGTEMAMMLTTALPEILRLCQKKAPHFIASITKAGKVHLRLQEGKD
jgi:hypothetical protein